MRRRLGALAGIAGPVAFTGAWIAGSLLQTGHRAVDIQISGLAAPDARDPWLMITGFLVLGGCSVAFGAALRERLGRDRLGRDRLERDPAPLLIQAGGLLTIVAGLLRRDHMLLTPGPESLHNEAHNVISVVIYADLVLAQLLLARRFGREPGWRAWRPWLLASAAATTAALAGYAADTSGAGAGVVQRVAVSIPLAMITAVAARLLTETDPAG